MAKNKFFEEIERFGFMNGKIRFGDYMYIIELMPLEVYVEYLEKIENGKAENTKDYYDAFQTICGHCLYREKKIKTLYQKLFKKPGEIIRIHDFKIDRYPYVLCDRFINDMFKVLVDKTFFQRLMELGVVEETAQDE